MATYQSIKYNVDYGGKAGALMPLLLFTSDGSDATASFTSKIDSTYDIYLFICNNIHPENSNPELGFNGSIDSGSNYNVTKTSSVFNTYHNEDEGVDSGTAVGNNADSDIAQGTGFQTITQDSGNDADQAVSGYIYLFNPSSTTFVKHWISRFNNIHGADYTQDTFTQGYFNTTSAIDAVQFKWSAGEIQAGTIGMFGVI